MSATRAGSFILAMVVAGAFTLVAAAPPAEQPPPRPTRPLVQSELDLLPAAKRLLTLQFDKASPEAALEILRKESGLTIEVQGKLPAGPALSMSFRDTAAKDVFVWLAKQLPVTYRAEPPNTLWIVTDVNDLRQR